jgi:hypothetical protein
MSRKTENRGSYQWVTLNANNINYVAMRTEYSKDELKAMLEAAKKQHKYEIKIPLGATIFTREER